MKRFTLLSVVLLGAFTATYAQKNLFDAADVDEGGWLWLNTQAKIDKYVSQANNEDVKIDPNGKIIQLVCADWNDYEDTLADPEYVGAGTDGEIGGPSAKTGGIRVLGPSAMAGTNGGAVVVRMPSCKTFAMFLSSDSKLLARLSGSLDETKVFGDYTTISAKYATVFGSLASAGQKEWSGMETLTNGSTDFCLASEKPIVALYRNFGQKNYAYIHGFKIITNEVDNAISDVRTDKQLGMVMVGTTLSLLETADVTVYDAMGQTVLRATGHMIDLSGLGSGVYVVKGQTGRLQQTIKVALR
jgi:hypothetical protein